MANVSSDILERLESGNIQIVETVKQNIREQFAKGMEFFSYFYQFAKFKHR